MTTNEAVSCVAIDAQLADQGWNTLDTDGVRSPATTNRGNHSIAENSRLATATSRYDRANSHTDAPDLATDQITRRDLVPRARFRPELRLCCQNSAARPGTIRPGVRLLTKATICLATNVGKGGCGEKTAGLPRSRCIRLNEW